MENREILIANTKTQRRDRITTDAATLGELKAAMTAAGIDYSDMTFTEGISKTQLLDDATQLPQNIMYKGEQTNNLVILLTNTKKNIASGATGTRLAAKELINTVPGLKEFIKETTGKNWTILPTDTIWEAITNFNISSATVKPSEDTQSEKPATLTDSNDIEIEIENEVTPSAPLSSEEYENASVAVALTSNIYSQVELLLTSGVLTPADVNELAADFIGMAKEEKSVEKNPVSTTDGSITDDDIDAMIDELDV